MPFKFTRDDLLLCDGIEKNAKQLRNRILELYNELVPRLKADPLLRNFVNPSQRHNKLWTKSPYVPKYNTRGKRYRPGSWIGFADRIKYPDPRRGIQFQYGIKQEDYWYGLWIQGDQETRATERDLYKILIKYTSEQIAASINSLGNDYWFWVRRDNDEKDIINNPADKVTTDQVEEFRTNLEKKRLYIALDKGFENFNREDLLSIEDVTSNIIKTTHELLPIYTWWSGLKPREMTAGEAYSALSAGDKLHIRDDEIDQEKVGERERTVNTRIGGKAIRRHILEIYGHQCALCDIKDDELLRASHISPWARDEENRGNPQNVICLCVLHDVLFERGMLRIHPDYKVDFANKIRNSGKKSKMIRLLLDNTNQILVTPFKNPPDPEFLKKKLARK
ncbi:MAG: HNH endonuclease [Candidatus Bathyarchaeota archaeon]|nr:HNH endonuclease [Candidatus Bathyarchaeota archaeon]